MVTKARDMIAGDVPEVTRGWCISEGSLVGSVVLRVDRSIDEVEEQLHYSAKVDFRWQ